MIDLRFCLLILLSGAASAGEWTYHLLSKPEISSNTGFWSLYLNDESNAVEIPGYQGSGYFCAGGDFHCVESDVFRFAVPKIGVAVVGQAWELKGTNYLAQSQQTVGVLGGRVDVWIIEASRKEGMYARYLYSNSRGLIGFARMQGADFHEGEFFVLDSEFGFAEAADGRIGRKE